MYMYISGVIFALFRRKHLIRSIFKTLKHSLILSKVTEHDIYPGTLRRFPLVSEEFSHISDIFIFPMFLKLQWLSFQIPHECDVDVNNMRIHFYKNCTYILTVANTEKKMKVECKYKTCFTMYNGIVRASQFITLSIFKNEIHFV